MSKKVIDCSECAYKDECDEMQRKICQSNSYIFFSTQEDLELCELMCGGYNEDKDVIR